MPGSNTGVKRSGSQTRSEAQKKHQSGRCGAAEPAGHTAPGRAGPARGRSLLPARSRLPAPKSDGKRSKKPPKPRPEEPAGLPAALTEMLRVNTRFPGAGAAGSGTPRRPLLPSAPHIFGAFLRPEVTAGTAPLSAAFRPRPSRPGLAVGPGKRMPLSPCAPRGYSADGKSGRHPQEVKTGGKKPFKSNPTQIPSPRSVLGPRRPGAAGFFPSAPVRARGAAGAPVCLRARKNRPNPR